MDYKRFDDKIVLRLKPGDKIIESIKEVAKKEDIKGAFFEGIGATNDLKMGILHPGDDDYSWDEYKEDLEIISLLGNITVMDDEKIVHAHINCGREDSSTIAGHLNDATISITAEIFINVIDGVIEKRYDSDIGLNIIEFD